MREAEGRLEEQDKEEGSMVFVTSTSSPKLSLASSDLTPFHAKTASMTGSVDSEAPSDSTLSFPSSTAAKPQDGSEADSERDSVSPQRGHEEVCTVFTMGGISE